MRHWQGLALVAVSVFGLTACGGKKSQHKSNPQITVPVLQRLMVNCALVKRRRVVRLRCITVSKRNQLITCHDGRMSVECC